MFGMDMCAVCLSVLAHLLLKAMDTCVKRKAFDEDSTEHVCILPNVPSRASECAHCLFCTLAQIDSLPVLEPSLLPDQPDSSMDPTAAYAWHRMHMCS